MKRSDTSGGRLVHGYLDRVVVDGFDADRSFDELVARLEHRWPDLGLEALREALAIALMVLSGAVSGDRDGMTDLWSTWVETYSGLARVPSERLRRLVARRRWLLQFLNDGHERIEGRVGQGEGQDRLVASIGVARKVERELYELDRRIQVPGTFAERTAEERVGTQAVHAYVEAAIAGAGEADALFEAHVAAAVGQSHGETLGALRETVDWVEFQLRQMYHRPVAGMKDTWSSWKDRFDEP